MNLKTDTDDGMEMEIICDLVYYFILFFGTSILGVAMFM